MSDHLVEANPDPELAAMQSVYKELKALGDDARKRVLDSVIALLGMPTFSGKVSAPRQIEDEVDEAALAEEEQAAPKYASFAELYDAAQAKTAPQKALVAGYWLQVCQGADSFDGFSLNKELKHLGQGVGNITVAINGLKNQKPALALQLKKSGKTRQARKTCKLTTAGVKAVETMIK